MKLFLVFFILTSSTISFAFERNLICTNGIQKFSVYVSSYTLRIDGQNYISDGLNYSYSQYEPDNGSGSVTVTFDVDIDLIEGLPGNIVKKSVGCGGGELSPGTGCSSTIDGTFNCH